MILASLIDIGVPVETAAILSLNLSDCYCCQELDGCKEATCSESVLEDIQPQTTLRCIT